MSKYLISVIDHATNSATPAEMVAIDDFNDRLVAAGDLIFAGGLASPATASVVDNRGGEPLVVAGPFITTREYVGGFWIVAAPDLDSALRLAGDASKACNRRVELRPFLGP